MFQWTIISEYTVVFIRIDIRRFFFGLLLTANAPFTAIACEILAAIREFLHGNQAAVATALAAVGAGFHMEFLQFIEWQDRRMLLTAFQRQNRRPIRAHKSGNIGTDNLSVQQFFHTAQYGIIVKSTALHDNMVAQFPHIL